MLLGWCLNHFHLTLSSDSKIVSGSLDKTVRVWDIETGNCQHTIDMGVFVWCVDLIGDYVMMGCGCDIKVRTGFFLLTRG